MAAKAKTRLDDDDIRPSKAFGRPQKAEPPVVEAEVSAREMPAIWISPGSLRRVCLVTDEETAAAKAAAQKDLLEGKKPVPKGQRPHLLITIGAPGAGKSTVAEAVAASQKDGDYVTIDLDTALKYHPRLKNLWQGVPNAATGTATGIGITTGYLFCNEMLEQMIVDIYSELLAPEREARYNIVLQSHSQTDIIDAKIAGFKVTLLFVGATLEEAIQRSRRRAVETGKFLSQTLSAQDSIVTSMWKAYREKAAWYGLWADQFLVADNRGYTDGGPVTQDWVARRVKKIPRGGPNDWWARMLDAKKLIDAACGVEDEKK